MFLWSAGKTEVVGTLAMSSNVLMISAPLLKVRQVVFVTGRTEALGSPVMALAGFCCCAVWFVMGKFYLGNSQVWSVNLCGCFANVICLCLFFLVDVLGVIQGKEVQQAESRSGLRTAKKTQ